MGVFRENTQVGPVLELLEDLFRDGEVFFALSPPFALEVQVDRDKLTGGLQAAGITESSYQQATNEVETILLAVVKGSEKEKYVSGVLASREISQEARESEGKLIGQRFDEVKAFLERIDPRGNLERRYRWKVAGKAPSYTTVDWDIKRKLDDSRAGELTFSYATCRIKFQKEFGYDPFLLLGGRAFDSVQVNFSREEACHLAKVMQTVVRHLEEVEERFPGGEA